MKATKKIVGAACALVAAVALSAGSTFAWFSTNDTVNADGMKIEVDTSNSYLVIGSQLTDITPATAEGFEYKTHIDLASTTKKLLPSAYEPVKTGEDDTTHTTTLAASGAGSIVDSGSWYTGKGESPTVGTLKGNKTPLNSEGYTFSDYVLVDDIFVSVAVGSDKVEHVYMTVTPATGFSWNTTNSEATNNSAISLVVLYQTVGIGGSLSTWKMEELNAQNNHAFTGGSLDLLAVESTQYIQVKVMVYFDGNNTDVKSSNAKNLTGITLNMAFSDTAPTTPVNPDTP